MKSKIYPFAQNRNEYPKSSFILKEEVPNEKKFSLIEYDTEHILKVLNDEDPTQDFTDFPKINEENLKKLLGVITKNIVEIEFN